MLNLVTEQLHVWLSLPLLSTNKKSNSSTSLMRGKKTTQSPSTHFSVFQMHLITVMLPRYIIWFSANFTRQRKLPQKLWLELWACWLITHSLIGHVSSSKVPEMNLVGENIWAGIYEVANHFETGLFRNNWYSFLKKVGLNSVPWPDLAVRKWSFS